jgi:hypothetical protein
MKKQILTILIVFTITQLVTAQNSTSQLLIRSTTGKSGSSEKVSLNNKNYIIQQSIGQTSAIGTFETNGYTLRQGFIQPNVLAKIIDINIPLDLKAIEYPNPFVDNISLSFNEKITGKVIVSIYDMLGRQLLSNSFNSENNIEINFSAFSIGHYILKVTANNKQFIKKILKK